MGKVERNYEEISKRAKQRAIAIMNEWEKEEITIEEAESIVRHLKDGITKTHYKMQHETSFRQVKN